MANHRAAGRAIVRPLKVSQGTRRDSRLPAGAVKAGMLGALATATIAVPLASATAGGLEGTVPLMNDEESTSAQTPTVEPTEAPAVDLPEASGSSEALTAQLVSSTPGSDEAAKDESGTEGGTVEGADDSGLTVEVADPEVQEIIEATGTSSSGYMHPVDAPITSGYGGRVHPVLGYTKKHDGTDFGAACGTPVHSAKAGTVVAVEYNSASGKRVKVDHGDGVITGYYHLQSQAVTEGQKIEQGDVIGEVGTTGRSTGCHLHFAKMDASGAYSDPMSLFR